MLYWAPFVTQSEWGGHGHGHGHRVDRVEVRDRL